MKKIIEDNCYWVLHEIEMSMRILDKKEVCKELIPLKTWLTSYLEGMERELNHNIYLLELDEATTYLNIFKKVQNLSRNLALLNSSYIPCIHRYKSSDDICLKLLSWLHNQHPQLEGHPFGVFDGAFMISSSPKAPTIYYLPNSSQHILLHLPLFFHETGHKFYSLHKPEMLDLVKELQEKLLKYFQIPYQSNNTKYEAQKRKTRTVIVDTWPNWIEELYCDAVGLRMGGVSYIRTFSNYLRFQGRTAFYLSSSYLAGSSHPVSWLRVKFLARQAIEYGLIEEGEALLKEWDDLADLQGIREQYSGFYQEDFYPHIRQCIDDMLMISEPMFYQDYESDNTEYDPKTSNFVELLNLAWRKFNEDLPSYAEWEEGIILKIKDNFSEQSLS